MPAPLRTSPDDWVTAGLGALAAAGPEGVRVEAVATALGVTKGGFYHHFADRQALLDAILDRWEVEVIDQVIALVEQVGGDARERLRSLFRHAESSPRLLATELAVRDWARRDPAVSARLARVDDRRLRYLRSLFAEVCPDRVTAEARSLVVLTLFVGLPLLVLDQDGIGSVAVLDEALRMLLR